MPRQALYIEYTDHTFTTKKVRHLLCCAFGQADIYLQVARCRCCVPHVRTGPQSSRACLCLRITFMHTPSHAAASRCCSPRGASVPLHQTGLLCNCLRLHGSRAHGCMSSSRLAEPHVRRHLGEPAPCETDRNDPLELVLTCADVPQKRTTAEEHLGMLGPLLRAEVGDRVHVHFLNRLSVATSIHAHGLRYAKNAEGAPYADGTSGAIPAESTDHCIS